MLKEAVFVVKTILLFVSQTHALSEFVARNLSGLYWSPMEVTNEADRVVTGGSEDAIGRGLWAGG